MTPCSHVQLIKRLSSEGEKKSLSLFLKVLNHFSASVNVTNVRTL